jgi:hypothetical protein
VLLYNDCDPVTNANCSSIPEPLRSDDAAAALGLATSYGGPGDQAAFRALVDAGGFEAIVFESSTALVEAATANRLATWIAGGGRLIFSYWDLDGSTDATVATTLRAALDVTTPATFDTPRTVVPVDGATLDLFAHITAPLGFSNIGIDDGDELATPTGELVARFTSTSGPGAAAVTHDTRVVTLGFLPVELVYQIVRDSDNDKIADVEELYTDALSFICQEPSP